VKDINEQTERKEKGNWLGKEVSCDIETARRVKPAIGNLRALQDAVSSQRLKERLEKSIQEVTDIAAENCSEGDEE